MLVAVGAPVVQDTTRVTEFAVELKVTRAVAAGPRTTVPASYPGTGLHDTRYAPPGRHSATTEPPVDVSTVEASAVEADVAGAGAAGAAPAAARAVEAGAAAVVGCAAGEDAGWDVLAWADGSV